MALSTNKELQNINNRLSTLDAAEISYDNSTSGLVATNVGAAIDESIEVVREKLTADRTYFLNVGTGSDSNDGLSSGTAFQTFGKLFSVLQNDLDLNGFKIIVEVTPGDYSAEGLLHLPVLVSGSPDTCGSSFDPDGQVIFNNSNGETDVGIIVDSIDLDHPAHYGIEGFTFTGTLKVTRNGSLNLDYCRFESSNLECFIVRDGGAIRVTGIIAIATTSARVFRIQQGGSITGNLDTSEAASFDFVTGYASAGSIVSGDSYLFISTVNNLTGGILDENLLSFTIDESAVNVPNTISGSSFTTSTYAFFNGELTGNVEYNNLTSGLDASTVKDAIDEISLSNPKNISSEATSTVTAVVGQIQLVDVSGGSVTVNPPSSPNPKDSFAVSDTRENATVNNITIDFVTAGQNFHASSQNDTIDTDLGYREYTYIDGTIGWIRTSG